MPKVRFETGQTVNFSTTPSQADIDEVASKLGIQKAQPAQMAAPTEQPMGFPEKALRATSDLAVGAAKGLGSTIAGASALGEKMLLDPISRLAGREPEKVKLGTELQEKVLKPEGTAQKIGFGAEQLAEFFVPGAAPAKVAQTVSRSAKLAKVAEEVPGLLRAGRALGRTAVRSGVEAGVVGGQTAIQTGGDKEATERAAIGGAVAAPILKTVGAAGKLLTSEPERLMGKALGFTKSQVRNLDKLASENKAYKGIKDFALKHGFGGSREQMAQQIDDRFVEMTGGSKPEVLAAITDMVPNDFKSAFAHLKSVYDVPGQEKVLSEINELSAKKSLTAAELDRVRSLMDNSLPTGAYKGAEPVKTEGLQNLIDPMRRTLEKLDKSDTIKRVNQDIRILYQMKKAIEHSKSGGVEGAAAFRTLMRGGATQVLTALGVPLPAIATVPYVVYQGATDFPQVASYIAQKLNGAQPKMPENIPLLLRKAIERWK